MSTEYTHWTPMLHKVPACSVYSGVYRLPTFYSFSQWGKWAVVRTGVLEQLHRRQALCVEGYTSRLSEIRINKESLNYARATKEWPSLLDKTSEESDFTRDVLRKSNMGVTLGGDVLGEKTIDVTTFGNLCVDIVLNVPSLPPPNVQEKFAYMSKLAASSPDERYWEAGGNSNFAIAAARLGLHCVALGHFGDEKYGSFLHEVLDDEGVQVVKLEREGSFQEHEIGDEATLLCWVLVDPDRRHGFCSRFDFKKDPAFKWIKELPFGAKEVIQRSKVLFCNGFLFDELSPTVIASAVDFANKSGCAVFFDPGPRGKSLFQGSIDQQEALNKLLSFSDVLLLTADEAEALTGKADPVLSAKQLLDMGQCTKWVVIKMGANGCLMTTDHFVYKVPAFKVDVVDTVGCGDSFAGAVVLGYTQGLPVVSTLALANAVGAATAMGCGAGRNVATMDDVIKILLSPSNESGKIQAFSMEHLRTVGMTGDFNKFSADGVNCSSLSMPFHIVTHEAVNLLRNAA